MEASVIDHKQKDAKPQDCLSCKVISSSALIICSLYVATSGIRAKLRSAKIASAVFATSLGYTGLARALDLYPFSMESNIDQSIQNSS